VGRTCELLSDGVSRDPLHSVTGFSPFYLFHGREIPLPSNDNLRAKISTEIPSHKQRLESLQNSLRLAYKLVCQASKMSHSHNKQIYDHKAKLREFNIRDLVYLYKPSIRPGLSRKFQKPWSSVHKVTAKISNLNYKIIDRKGKERTVHVNWIKPAYNQELWKPKTERRPIKRLPQKQALLAPQQMVEEEETEIRLGPFPLLVEIQTIEVFKQRTPTNRPPDSPAPTSQAVDTTSPERHDTNYSPPRTPRSRRGMQPTRIEPPLTRSRTRAASQEHPP
jgi:hypothetical protein